MKVLKPEFVRLLSLNPPAGRQIQATTKKTGTL
jgi:hypothetical protein